MRTTCFNIKSSAFFPQSVFMCFVSVIISLNSINQLVFVIET
jgi:hypothetical protein